MSSVKKGSSDHAQRHRGRRGVHSRAVYWHFKDKAALFVALAEDIEASTGISEEQLAKMPADSLEDYRTLILGFLDFLQNDRRYRKFYELAYFRTEWTEELAPCWNESGAERDGWWSQPGEILNIQEGGACS